MVDSSDCWAGGRHRSGGATKPADNSHGHICSISSFIDRIPDFAFGDSIDFNSAAFGNIGVGVLDSANFTSGAAENVSANSGFRCNTASLTLYFDSNGDSGGLTAMTVLDNSYLLRSTDIHLV